MEGSIRSTTSISFSFPLATFLHGESSSWLLRPKVPGESASTLLPSLLEEKTSWLEEDGGYLSYTYNRAEVAANVFHMLHTSMAVYGA